MFHNINLRICEILQSLPSRERGLKYTYVPPLSFLGEVAPFAGAWIEIWVSQAEFARSGIVFDFEDSSAQAEAAKKLEKYVQDNSLKGISQTTNILETRYTPNTSLY